MFGNCIGFVEFSGIVCLLVCVVVIVLMCWWFWLFCN